MIRTLPCTRAQFLAKDIDASYIAGTSGHHFMLIDEDLGNFHCAVSSELRQINITPTNDTPIGYLERTGQTTSLWKSMRWMNFGRFLNEQNQDLAHGAKAWELVFDGIVFQGDEQQAATTVPTTADDLMTMGLVSAVTTSSDIILDGGEGLRFRAWWNKEFNVLSIRPISDWIYVWLVKNDRLGRGENNGRNIMSFAPAGIRTTTLPGTTDIVVTLSGLEARGATIRFLDMAFQPETDASPIAA